MLPFLPACDKAAATLKILTEEYGYKREELTWHPGIMGVPLTFLDKYNPE